MSRPNDALNHMIVTCPDYGTSMLKGDFCPVCDLGVTRVRPKPAPKPQVRLILRECHNCGGAVKPDLDERVTCMICARQQPQEAVA